MSERQGLGQPLRGFGHRFEREHEARQQDVRKHEEEGHLHGLLLSLRERREEQAERQVRCDEHEGEPVEHADGADQRHIEHELAGSEDQRHLHVADGDVGDDLADDELDVLDRRDDELFESAALALASDGHGGQHHHGHRQNDADEPRHDVDRGAEVRVVPSVGLQLHRCQRSPAAALRELRHHQIARAGGDERRGGVRRAGDGLRIRAVDDQLHLGVASPHEVAREARGHDQSDPGTPGAQGVLDLLEVAGVSHDVVEARGPHRLDQIARGGALVLVVDHGRDVANVGIDGVAEEQQLHHRQHEHHGHRETVAPQLEQLFPRDDPRTQVHAALLRSARCSSRTMLTKASSTVTRVARARLMSRSSSPSTVVASSTGSVPPRVATRSRCP